MNKRRIWWGFAVVLLVAGSTPRAGAQSYTYPELVRRMTDMRELAKLPPAGEKTSLASSYDRSSVYDAATDMYIKWGANADGKGVVRMEGDNAVLAEIRGPGCIWRTWSATAGGGHVKMYLDGGEAPAVDLPFTDYFSGKVKPFDRANIVYELRPEIPGFDNYTPIPFNKSCKIVGEKGWGNYYQFTYTQFPAGVTVPMFKMALSPEDNAALDEASRVLSHCGEEPVAYKDEKTESVAIPAAPGQETVVADLKEAGAITALKVKFDLPSDPEAQRVLLSELTVRITWDDEKSPSIWSPLGDFFGFVGGARPYQSLPLGLLPDGTFYSYWYMPFARRARIVVGNDGPQTVAMAWQVSHAPLERPIGELGRFHAKWHRDAFLPARADRAPDWTLLTTQGRGRYVGTHLHGWNPRGGWWGEGDDKFFIDGEKFPSTFGTGSEDYFGYAWSSANKFSRPYHNQILNEHNEGHFDDNRWHVADSAPFQKSFEGCIEKYFPNGRGTLYAAEAFWYLSADGTDPYKPVPVADRVGYWVMPTVYEEPGAIEGESLLTTSPQARSLQVENTMGWSDKYSGGHQLLWWPAPKDASLTLYFYVPASGKYRVLIQCDKRADRGNGTVQASIDGKAAGEVVDLAGMQSSPGPPADLGVLDLAAGEHTLGIQILEKKDPTKRFGFGLDYIKLVPAE